jgi:uncharacterized protein
MAVAAYGAASGEEMRGAKPIRSLVEIRNSEVVRQHWDLSCGAAVTATIFTYQLGQPVSEYAVAKDMLKATNPLLVRQRLGFSLLDLKRYAERHGADAAGYGNLQLDDLPDLAPAIIAIHVHGYDHYVVFRGRRGDRVLFADPAFGNRTMKIDDFRQVWTSGIAFVVTERGLDHMPNRMGAPASLFIGGLR